MKKKDIDNKPEIIEEENDDKPISISQSSKWMTQTKSSKVR